MIGDSNPPSMHDFDKLELNPSEVAVIIVRYSTSYILGLKFLNKTGVVLLEAGKKKGDYT
jgi:hypothetical protein